MTIEQARTRLGEIIPRRREILQRIGRDDHNRAAEFNRTTEELLEIYGQYPALLEERLAKLGASS